MSELEQFEEIVRRLRAKDGCPWDKVQTHESLKPYCIEEAAEVICGINILHETGSADNLKEELGDLLMQIIMHAQIAEEEGLFTMDDVIKGISDKMIRRHPHVFGNEIPGDDALLKAQWEEIKAGEKIGREWEKQYLPTAMNEAADLIDMAKKRKGF